MNIKPLSVTQASVYFKAVSHPTRLELVRILLSQPMTVSQLCRKLKKRQCNISQHLRYLRDRNLTHYRQIGKNRLYKLDSRFRTLIMQIMNLIK